MKRSVSSRGFTIVELLIVIVVIGILAAITVVAYSGVQQKARNAQIISGVKVYETALLAYAIDNHSYPGDYVCLGAGYPSNKCWNGPNGTFATNATFDTALAKYLPAVPVLSTHPLQITDLPDYRLGAILITSNGLPRIIYYLDGAGQTCIGGGTYTEMQGTQCLLTLQDPTSL